jgi:hypothetical protein
VNESEYLLLPELPACFQEESSGRRRWSDSTAGEIELYLG